MIFSLTYILIIFNFLAYKFIYKLNLYPVTKLFLILLNFIFLSGYLLKIITFNYQYTTFQQFSLINPDFSNFKYSDFTSAVIDVHVFYIIFILFLISIKFLKNNKILINPKCHVSSFHDNWFFAIILLGFFFKALQFYLGIGKMGVDNLRLPFMLDTIIFRFQNFVVYPAFAYFFYKHKFRNQKLNFIFFIYTSFNIIFGSRSGLFFFFLNIIILVYLLNIKLIFKKQYFIFLFLLIPFSFYFFFSGTILRGINMGQSTDVDIFYLFSLIYSESAWSIFFESVTNRFIGLEGLIFTYNVPLKYDFFAHNNYVYFFTKDVVGISHDFDFRSPGLFASIKFLLPFKSIMISYVVFGISLFISTFLIENLVSRISIIFQFSFVYFLYGQLSEGYIFIEDVITYLLVYLIFILIFSRSFIYNNKLRASS
jgi:hypothetical protein